MGASFCKWDASVTSQTQNTDQLKAYEALPWVLSKTKIVLFSPLDVVFSNVSFILKTLSKAVESPQNFLFQLIKMFMNLPFIATLIIIQK